MATNSIKAKDDPGTGDDLGKAFQSSLSISIERQQFIVLAMTNWFGRSDAFKSKVGKGLHDNFGSGLVLMKICTTIELTL